MPRRKQSSKPSYEITTSFDDVQLERLAEKVDQKSNESGLRSLITDAVNGLRTYISKITLGALNDVTIINPQQNSVLQYIGGVWVASGLDAIDSIDGGFADTTDYRTDDDIDGGSA